MGLNAGMNSKKFQFRVIGRGSPSSGCGKKDKNSRPIAPEKQEKIDQILFEMKNSSDRMQKLLEVFSRINRRL